MLRVVSSHGEMVDLPRSFERDQTFYDWQHYISLIERKPGALRNGAPFKTMPLALQELQRQLLKNPGGDRVMTQVLSTVPALQAGRISAELCSMCWGTSGSARPALVSVVDTPITLQTPPVANVLRYDSLRATDEEVQHVQ